MNLRTNQPEKTKIKDNFFIVYKDCIVLKGISSLVETQRSQKVSGQLIS